MRYVPFFQIDSNVSHLMVDSYGKKRSCVLELNHWPGNGTPPGLKRDTSTESVVDWVVAEDQFVNRADIACVSNDHFDLDGLLAMWAAIYHDRLSDFRQNLVNVATTEDFNRFVDEPTLRIALEIMELEKQVTRGLVRAGVSSTDRFTAGLYEALLPEVQRSLGLNFRFEAEWGGELRFVLRSLEDLKTGQHGARIDEFRDIDLALVTCDRPLHPYAVHSVTSRCRLLVITPETRPCFSYRYESFVEMVSRPILPRMPLKPLATLLSYREKNGIWSGEGMLTAHPRLQLFSLAGSVVQSSQEVTELLSVVAGYLRALASAGHPGWLPVSGLSKGPELDVLPPTLERCLEDLRGEL
jgi:hypothetical protein